MVVDLKRELGTDAVAIRTRTGQLYPEHIVLIAVLITKQPCRTVSLSNHKVQIAVIVEVPVGSTAPHDRPLQRRTQLGRHVFELTLSPVTKYQGRFRVLQMRLGYADVIG